MKTIRSYLAVLLVFAGAAPAAAQAVKVEFKDGLVSLSAQNASLRAILTEWTRQGGTQILNGEKVTGAGITVEFTNTPERQVLESLLRSVSGYVLAPRPEGSTARSSFDRILILPTSAPAPRPATAPAPTAFRPQPAPPSVVFDPNDSENNPLLGDDGPGDPDEDIPARGPRRVQRLPPGGPPVPAGMPTPTPGMPPPTPGMPTPMPMPMPGVRANQPPQPDPDGAEPQADNPPPPRPTNPFGVERGSTQPGPGNPVPPRQNRNGPPNVDEEP